jgi:hypothetical protein
MKQPWIDCQKILPELGVPVIVWCWKISDIDIAHLDEAGNWSARGWPLSDVTHWMPKPGSPKEEIEKKTETDAIAYKAKADNEFL